MFKFIAFFACIAVAAAAPGLLAETHAIVQPAAVLTKTAYVDTSASSAITHQSNVNLLRKVPVVQTYAAPVVHAAPVVTPVVHAAPVVAPVVHAAPVVSTYAAAPLVHSVPVVHSAPLVKTVVSPVAYTAYHK
ncbi:larval/pupal cuticle protein H1C [Drosophila sulfurigaster albostrigata]|uniref:larval/pupal cuticle protein H1C n=1 Tax=Drosophila sulfurigaster albostrigata TaxID=89887 RepID=UPI002D21ED21|nr:larval/pupal cuticle protein H1C [Drosophila sulfurigaster albostrigata]